MAELRLNNSKGESDSEKKAKNKFRFDIEPSLIPVFLRNLERYGLTNTVTCLVVLQHLAERRGVVVSDEDRVLARKMEEFFPTSTLSHQSSESTYAFRCVSVDSDPQLEEIIRQANEHGGKKPTDHSTGVCVDQGSKVSEYLLSSVGQNKPTALFVYDNSYLEPLSEEEIKADPSLNFVAGYGRKPISGYELKDSLIGTIAIPIAKK